MNRFEESLVFECAFTCWYMNHSHNRNQYNFWRNRFLALKRALDNAIGERTEFIHEYDNMIYIYTARELFYKIDVGNDWEINKF